MSTKDAIAAPHRQWLHEQLCKRDPGWMQLQKYLRQQESEMEEFLAIVQAELQEEGAVDE